MCIHIIIYFFSAEKLSIHYNVLFVLVDSPRVTVRMQIQIGPKTYYSNAKTFRHYRHRLWT